MTSVAKLNNEVVNPAINSEAEVPAKIKDFGKVDVVTVSDELSEKMVWAGKRYKSIVSTRAKQLVELKEIGSVLLEYRQLHKSDKAYGKAVAKTPLKVVSQQDRNDLMWLASNWTKIEDLRSKGTLSSNSVGVLRKQLRELESAKAEDAKPKGLTAKSTTSKAKSAPTASLSEQRDGMKSTTSAEEPKGSAKITASTPKELCQAICPSVLKTLKTKEQKQEFIKLLTKALLG